MRHAQRSPLLAAVLAALALLLAACAPPDAPSHPPASATALPASVPAPTTPAPILAPALATPTPAPNQPDAEPATPIPTPTPPASATASAAAAPISTATLIPLTDSRAAELSARFADAGMAYLTEFTERFTPRESGTDGERVAAEFLADEMRGLGYDVELTPFEITLVSREFAPLSLVSPDARTLSSRPLGMSGEGDVVAPLAAVGKALADDIPAEGLAGKIALIERGEITFEEKARRVADAGALGAVVYNNAAGGFAGTLMTQANIPVVSARRADGLGILERLESGERVEARVRVAFELRGSQNVVAEKRGSRADGGVVILGAHHDTVPESQGANDNGTGVTALALIARELAQADFPFTLRFVFFGAEEIGLRGSRRYVEDLSESELADIIAMLNFDAMGAGNAAFDGDAALAASLSEIAAAAGLSARRSTPAGGFSSDHAPFRDAGAPVAFFFGDDFSRINSPDDQLRFVDPAVMGVHIALALRLLDRLAAGSE